MEKPMSQVTEVFGQFAANFGNGNVVLYATETEAREAVTKAAKGQEHSDLANAYAKARGYEGKTAVGKVNVIIDFLTYAESAALPVDAVEVPVEF
jgi:hypothetical protein